MSMLLVVVVEATWLTESVPPGALKGDRWGYHGLVLRSRSVGRRWRSAARQLRPAASGLHFDGRTDKWIPFCEFMDFMV